jgi:hypothetical protein
VGVTPRPDQERFVAPVTYYLCLSIYGQIWHPLAIVADGAVIGHVLWAIDDADHSRWIGGFVVDAAAQARGIGRAALEAMIGCDCFSKACSVRKHHPSIGKANISTAFGLMQLRHLTNRTVLFLLSRASDAISAHYGQNWDSSG